MGEIEKSTDLQELLKPYCERASEAEERLSRLKAALVNKKDVENGQLSPVVEVLQSTLETTIAEREQGQTYNKLVKAPKCAVVPDEDEEEEAEHATTEPVAPAPDQAPQTDVLTLSEFTRQMTSMSQQIQALTQHTISMSRELEVHGGVLMDLMQHAFPADYATYMTDIRASVHHASTSGAGPNIPTDAGDDGTDDDAAVADDDAAEGED